MKNKLIIDLDGTITIDEKSVPYELKKKNEEIVNRINFLVKENYLFEIYSSRSNSLYDRDLKKIKENTLPVINKWLLKNKVNINPDSIIIGKPCSGDEGWYIDDKALSPDEFLIKYDLRSYNKKFDIIVPFYNEEENIKLTYHSLKKCERLINVNNYIFVNNGSIDKTALKLNNLADLDPKVKIVSVSKNEGYGLGMKEGINFSNADFVILNHADLQFDLYIFILNHWSKLFDLLKDEKFCIVPKRLGRGVLENFQTNILKGFIYFILGIKSDFNGQPKIFTNLNKNEINNLLNDYCFDLSLVNYFKYKTINNLSIIVKNREFGLSSWSGNFYKRVSIFYKYLTSAVKLRFKTK